MYTFLLSKFYKKTIISHGQSLPDPQRSADLSLGNRLVYKSHIMILNYTSVEQGTVADLNIRSTYIPKCYGVWEPSVVSNKYSLLLVIRSQNRLICCC